MSRYLLGRLWTDGVSRTMEDRLHHTVGCFTSLMFFYKMN